MIRTFTLNDLVSYFYGEATEQETTEITQALSEDKRLQEKYAEIVAATEGLETVSMTPSKGCIDRILGYARARNRQGRLTRVDA